MLMKGSLDQVDFVEIEFFLVEMSSPKLIEVDLGENSTYHC